MRATTQLDLLPVQTDGLAAQAGGYGAVASRVLKPTGGMLRGNATQILEKFSAAKSGPVVMPAAAKALTGDPLLLAAPWLLWADSLAFEMTEVEYLEAHERTRLEQNIGEDQYYAELCRQDLYFLAKFVLHQDDGKPNKLLWRYHKPSCDLATDPRYPRQMWLEPRGWLKSTVKTEAKIIQRIIRDPNTALFLWSETLDLSANWLDKIKGHFLSNAYFRRLFADLCPAVGQREFGNKSEFTIPNRKFKRLEPTLMAVSAGMELKGFHPDEQFFDDLIGRQSSENADHIRKAEQSFRDSFAMLPNKERGPVQVIGTRWNFGDVHQVIADSMSIENGGDFLSCVTDCELPDGSPSLPELDNAASLAVSRRTLGASYFAVMRQNPIADGEGIKPADIIDHETTVEDLRRCNVYMLLDSALATTARSDFSAIGIVAATPDGFLDVIEYTRARVDPFEVMKAINDYWARYKQLGIPLQGIGLQGAVLDRVIGFFVQKEAVARNEFLPWKRVDVAGIPKVVRMKRLIPLARNHKLRVLKNAMPELREELLRLPAPKPHDDLCDMLAGFTDVVRWPEAGAAAPKAPATPEDLDMSLAGMWRALSRQANAAAEPAASDDVLLGRIARGVAA